MIIICLNKFLSRFLFNLPLYWFDLFVSSNNLIDCCLRATQHLYFDYDFLVLLVCPQAPPEICLLTRLATADSHLISKKKKNSLEFPSTYALKCLPFIHIFSSSSLLLLCVCVSLCPSIVTIRGYRKLDSFDQSVRARRTREIELYVSFSLSLFSASLFLSILLVALKESLKKRRKKKGKRKRISGWSRRSSHLYHVLLIITIAVRCLREMLC
jgi:hypothetical protein